MLSENAGEPNLPVYDTTGRYTDPNVEINVEQGLSRARTQWVKERGGVEEMTAARSSRKTTAMSARSTPPASTRWSHRCAAGRPQIHAARIRRAGIITKEMIYVAERENLGRKQQLERAEWAHNDGESFGASVPLFVAGIRARRDCARPRHHPLQHQPRRA